MNENINLVEILKDALRGTKLWKIIKKKNGPLVQGTRWTIEKVGKLYLWPAV